MTTTTTESPARRRRRVRPSARLRILGWIVALTALAAVGGLLLSRQLLLEQLDGEINRDLEQEMSELRQLAQGRDPETGEPFGGDVEAIFDTFLRRNLPAEGEVFYTFVDRSFYKATTGPLPLGEDPQAGEVWSGLTEPSQGELSTSAGPVRWLAVSVEGEQEGPFGVFVVANFLDERRQEIHDVINTGMAVSGGILVLAISVGWVAAGRILRPVRDVTETARSISESDLSRRIATEGDDEIAELAHTFNAMLERLETAFASQQAFIDDAGHELRTPITVVRGHLELLSDDPEERRETTHLVTDELDRMSRIVDDLLLLAKLEQPAFLQRETVETEPFTLELFAKMRALGDREWRLAGAASGTAVADPQRLTQAMMNLARNAVEHTLPGDTITVGSSASDGEVRIWVADTGPGIAPGEQDVIFERFARGGDRRRRSEGAGLGLAIVRSVADAHHARVVVDSAPGDGARFTMILRGTPGEVVPASPSVCSPAEGIERPHASEEEPTWPGS